MRGRRFGRFVVEEPLGEGAYATVWTARHVSGQPVALKVSKHRGMDLESTREEAIRLASLDHPGIVHIYDAGEVDGHAWLALELAAGTLAELESPLPLTGLGHHLLLAVGHLHAHGIVHRDLKPRNILVGCQPRTGRTASDRAGVRLADLGIAWTVGSAARPTSGTPGWTASEQGSGAVHPSGDVFAVARVLQSLADGRARERLAPWFARALSPDLATRFPSAAHARAALPDHDVGRTLVVVSEPPSFMDCTETATRPVVLRLSDPLPTAAEPVPVAQPIWPDSPPVPTPRIPRPALLDVGLALLPYRPVAPSGRAELLLEGWKVLASGSLALNGQAEDLEEVAALLECWSHEAGRTLTVTRGPGGLHVPPLAAIHLVNRAEALGFEPESALRLATGARSAPEMRETLLQAIRADLVDVTPDGLVLRGWLDLPRTSGSVHDRLEEAWWLGDTFQIARCLPELTRTPVDSDVYRAQVALHRNRLEIRRDVASARALMEHAERLPAQAHALRVALLSEAVGVAIRARDVPLARSLLAQQPEQVPERLAATLCMQQGFVGIMERDPDVRGVLERAAELCGGRYRSMAYATLTDLTLQHGTAEEAVAAGRRAVDAIDSSRPGDEVAVRCALVLALMHASPVDEDAISDQLALAAAAVPRVANRAAIARLTLFRAQQAMRLKDWERADRLLYEAQMMLLRSGGSATFIVLNHALVALNRGDLAAIASLTPLSWTAELSSAPAYVRPLMQLHWLFACLGSGEGLDDAFRSVEAPDEPLSPMTHEGIRLAAGLAPEHAERLLALTQEP